MVLAIASVIIGLIGIVIAIGIYWLKDRNNKIAYNQRKESAHRDIVSVISMYVTESSAMRNIDPTTYESLIRSKAKEYKVEFDIEREFTDVIDDLKTKVFENRFVPIEDKSRQISAINKLKESLIPTDFLLDNSLTNALNKKVTINWFMTALQSVFWFCITFSLTAIVEIAFFLWLRPNQWDVFYTMYPFYLAILYAIVVGLRNYKIYHDKKLRQLQAIDYYEKSVYEIIKWLLIHHKSKARLRREYQTTINNAQVISDKVLLIDDTKIPIDIKYEVIQQTIDDIGKSMRRLAATKGIILGYMKVNEVFKNRARSLNIIIRDKIVSQSDIEDMLREEEILG